MQRSTSVSKNNSHNTQNKFLTLYVTKDNYNIASTTYVLQPLLYHYATTICKTILLSTNHALFYYFTYLSTYPVIRHHAQIQTSEKPRFFKRTIPHKNIQTYSRDNNTGTPQNIQSTYTIILHTNQRHSNVIITRTRICINIHMQMQQYNYVCILAHTSTERLYHIQYVLAIQQHVNIDSTYFRLYPIYLRHCLLPKTNR
eukprot:TRINITY_DN3756_c0_g1_i6.p2 TRINITY_DN3756_c0_g1~~TRINITY_DN3756_c0_g1_i6.p2  ORF type:complete len:200 (-),score=-31.20 TRINITY_DN3756_c0_g1_i6:466-1065(-)